MSTTQRLDKLLTQVFSTPVHRGKAATIWRRNGFEIAIRQNAKTPYFWLPDFDATKKALDDCLLPREHYPAGRGRDSYLNHNTKTLGERHGAWKVKFNDFNDAGDLLAYQLIATAYCEFTEPGSECGPAG